MKKITAKLLLVLFLTAQFYGISFLFPKKLDSANLTSVSDTLSNNRLSFRGELDGAHSAGTAVITLNTSSTPGDSRNTSTGSASLMANESVQVGANNSPITLKTIESASRIVLSSGITNAQSDNTMVVATSSAVHTVTFTPVSVINGGAFRTLIPAASEAAQDGYPDATGFDFSTTAPTVSCSGGGSNMTFQTGTATASAIQVGSTYYHSFECRYNGSGASPAAATMYIGTPAAGKLINPAPASTTRLPGQADTYTFRVRHTYGTAQSYSVVDETLGTLGVVEAVRVTATVSPTLTFQISGRASGTSNCGQSAGATTTYNTAPFGTVSTSSFTNLAQMLSVSTNAAGGYAVTASESGVLTAYNVTGTPTIANTTCDSGTCTYNQSTSSDWDDTTKKGFGYGLQSVNGAPVPASKDYDDCASSTFCAFPFGTTGVTIMSESSPVDSDQAYVCYRIIVSGTQAAGDYENYVIYIATATF